MKTLAKYAKFIPYLVIILLLVYIRECKRCPEAPPPVTTTDTIIRIDTVRITGPVVYKPIPEIIIDTFVYMQEIDTEKILSEYKILRKYNLPITNDTNSKITVFANVQFNRISDWTYTAEIYPRTTTIEHTTVYTPKPRTKLFVGAYLASNGQNLGISPSVMIQTKKDHAYFTGYDILNGNLSFGMFYKIKLKK